MDSRSGFCGQSWNEVSLLAHRQGQVVSAQVRFAAGQVCLVEVSVGSDLEFKGEGPDLFEALAPLRRRLEGDGVLLACHGSRRDVFPSPMLRQASNGRLAYVLTIPRSAAKPATVDIFAAAPELAELGSVTEQRDWFDRWRNSGIGQEGSQ